MATTFKTPGVYIKEPDSFPPSIVGVDTALPAFIGYTERATKDRKIVTMQPVRISSMADYERTFGRAYRELYSLSPNAPGTADTDLGEITLDGGKTTYHLVESGAANFYLYDCLRHFYANGGGDCYIVSCSNYVGDDHKTVNPLSAGLLTAGLEAIKNVVGPTMLLVPDAVLLPQDGYQSVIQAMLRQCGEVGDRVALFDIRGGDDPKLEGNSDEDPVTRFRDAVAGQPDQHKYGIAYFPFIYTSVVQPTDLTIANFDPEKLDVLKTALNAAVDAAYPADEKGPNKKGEAVKEKWVKAIGSSKAEPGPADPPLAEGTLTHKQLLNGLMANIPAMGDLLKHMAAARNTLPASPAMAGVYATIDRDRGVGNAPANVGIIQLIAPVVDINAHEQEDLNAPTGGISINAIRTVPGRGTLVWGARTLDGNSNDWRYIQVRRTMIYVEQSVKTALNSFVFAPNTASTWVTVTSMIESFLHGLWAAGGLMGTTPGEAYSVRAGLGSTMTADDVLNGIMRVQIILQMVRPAEFIELTFEQQMLGGA